MTFSSTGEPSPVRLRGRAPDIKDISRTICGPDAPVPRCRPWIPGGPDGRKDSIKGAVRLSEAADLHLETFTTDTRADRTCQARPHTSEYGMWCDPYVCIRTHLTTKRIASCKNQTLTTTVAYSGHPLRAAPKIIQGPSPRASRGVLARLRAEMPRLRSA